MWDAIEHQVRVLVRGLFGVDVAGSDHTEITNKLCVGVSNY